ncbi:MAG: hypothetical protein ACM3ZE_22660 [Myxococcales bacterium]
MNGSGVVGLFALAGMLLSCSSPGGSISTEDEGNVCETNKDCGEGRCVSGHCKARESLVRRLLVEVKPLVSANSGEYGDIRYFFEHEADVSSKRDFELDVVADLTVAVRPPSDDCVLPGLDVTGYLPIRLRVGQDPRISGISVMSSEAESDASGVGRAKGNLVSVSLAPGAVDLYIDPTGATEGVGGAESSSDLCALAPVLVKGQQIQPGSVSLEHRLAAAKPISVDVRALAAGGASPLEGWMLDMVEPIDGRRISSRRLLTGPVVGSDGKLHYQVRLAYNPVMGVGAEALAGSELFRLSPPAGIVAPKHFIVRSALDLFGTDQVVLPEETGIAASVVVRGLVEADTGAGGTPLLADVVATLDPGAHEATGMIASFQATTRTDEQGRFKLELVPGNYRVTTVPVDGSKYAAQDTTWAIAPTPNEQAGKLISVSESPRLVGTVISQSKRVPLADATVLASPSSLGKRSTFLDELLAVSTKTGARAQVGVADGLGAFEVPVDPGLYDIIVRPAQGSGYPWAVRAGTKITKAGEVYWLNEIEVRNPVTYSGTVTVPGQSTSSPRVPMPGALLRFYVLFDESDQLADPGEPAVSAVEIGQTRTDTNGAYRLLLPDRLN